ncbi:MAG TPA: aldo/keto reductase [Anaerolineales bacterium]|nr:aldo/keto reductase [Anaerolineales bacterium]
MKYETIHNASTGSARRLTLPKIGFGTWKIGGGSTPDPAADSKSLAALHSALEIGYTHFDTAEMYAGGHSEELLGRAIREAGAQRENLFITTKVHPRNLRYDAVLKACDGSLRRLNMDYIDLYLIHWPGTGVNYEETFRALNKLVRDSRVKYLGVSNFNVKLLKQAQSLSETPVITNQVPYSVSERSYVRNGMLEYCQQNDIIFTAYSPVDEGRLKTNQVLRSIAEAHKATPYQIALAWLTSQPRVITIPMSVDPQHIRENFESADLELTQSEIEQITS